PHVPIQSLSAGVPVLHRSLLAKWPANERTVVGLNDELMRVFKGPRVLFPDGFSKTEHNVRAVYFEKPATFTHSIGVIAGPAKDKALLKFAAVYLRSSLARYFLMMRGWKMLCERNGVHLTDVETFPFFDPSAAPKPKAAARALERVEEVMDELENLSDLEQLPRYQKLQEQLDGLVFDYFGLNPLERELVRETVRVLMPSVRPRSYKSLDTPAQHPASKADFALYAKTLADALTSWREKLDGRGHFNVRVVTSQPSREGPQGIVRIVYSAKETTAGVSEIALDDALLSVTLRELRRQGLAAIPSGDALQLVPDARIWTKDSLSLVRPLVQRNWTMRVALRDAEDIVRTIQSKQKPQRSRRKADARG
ncbi:MAG: hypothetical protein JNL81_12015, partial [Hyphomonadaceae bacterium]|nr:hypothetical protein [Hyphomonadaceae bacterium]